MIFIPDQQLDFHDLDVRNPFEIERELEIFIEDSYIKGAETLLIITGKGLKSERGPVIRPIVEKALKQNKYVTRFNRAGFTNGGSGAFEVYLLGATML